jgi:hypothetical protein
MRTIELGRRGTTTRLGLFVCLGISMESDVRRVMVTGTSSESWTSNYVIVQAAGEPIYLIGASAPTPECASGQEFGGFVIGGSVGNGGSSSQAGVEAEPTSPEI